MRRHRPRALPREPAPAALGVLPDVLRAVLLRPAKPDERGAAAPRAQARVRRPGPGGRGRRLGFPEREKDSHLPRVRRRGTAHRCHLRIPVRTAPLLSPFDYDIIRAFVCFLEYGGDGVGCVLSRIKR